MTNHEIGWSLLALGTLLGGAHVLGYLFERMRQPRLLGEILTGVLLGPFVLGRIAPSLPGALFQARPGNGKTAVILDFLYWLGLILLMFTSGSHARRIWAPENRKETAMLLGIGTSLPFILILVLGSFSLLPLGPLTGPSGNGASTLLILAIAVAVSSIPVVSRIFAELGILHTRFASIILGSAVFEDVILWGVLAIATAMSKTNAIARADVAGSVASHVGSTVAFVAVALVVLPPLLERFQRSRWNIVLRASPLGYAMLILFAYVVAAARLEVNLVFAGFLAGFGIMGGSGGAGRDGIAKAFEVIQKFSTSTFIPVYFALVGFKLVLGLGLSLPMLALYLAGSSLLALISVGLAAWLAGLRGLDAINIAVTTNARGGPGIMLASVAYDAGLISASFFTTLVLTAVITSQMAGAWLRFVLSKGWPLLSTDPAETWQRAVPETVTEK